MILGVHDLRNFIVKEKGSWVEGARHPGITIYNDPVEITFRKNDSDSRKDMVIKLDDDNKWVAYFYEGDEITTTVEI